ncbi:MAG: polyprenyl synthetase family protein [Coriobacteriales bacterium]|jgi:geranylgeranyl diphosphate synthase type I
MIETLASSGKQEEAESQEREQDLLAWVAELSREFDQSISDLPRSSSHPDLDRYLYAPYKKYVGNGGKRMRPVLCELGCMAVGGTAEVAQNAALSIESFHQAALIRDDIEDGAVIRHGKPCIHVLEGDEIAFNASDYALSLVGQLVLFDELLDGRTKIRILKEISNSAARTVEGQALDIGWSRDGRRDIGIDDYIEMAESKTAWYSGACPLAVGAIAGGGTESEISGLREFGRMFGLAFQIHDDLLDITCDEGETGKKRGMDIAAGKLTYMTVYALRRSEPSAAGELNEILSAKSADDADIERGIEIVRDSGAVQSARERISLLVKDAKKILLDTVGPSRARDALQALANRLVDLR